MTGPLETVTVAARNRETATTAYLSAILRARAEGHSLAAIGHAAGVTKQSVWEMIHRHEKGG